MKQGRTLTELAAELERQATTKKDYVGPQGAVDAVVVEGEVELVIKDTPHPLTSLAHGQLAGELEIPTRYYDRMRAEAPDLLASNVNTWLKRDPEHKRMFRALDGKVRAVLSPKYRTLDNYDLANAVLPALIQHKVEIMSTELTERRLYIKGYLPALSDVLPPGLAYGTGHHIFTGDRGPMMAAIVISNSEVGAGTLRIEPSVYTLRCTNLAILKSAAMKKYHVGKAFDADANWEVFRTETRVADDTAFFLKVRDITQAAFDPAVFQVAMDSIRRAAQNEITSDDLPSVIDMVVEELSITPKATGGILKALAAGGDMTQYGLSAAITRAANDADTYELATELEYAGGELLELAPAKWEAIATAKAA